MTVESVDYLPGQSLGMLALPLVDEQGAAAALLSRHDNVISVFAQDPCCSLIDVGKEEALDAAEKKPNPPSFLASGGHHIGQLLA
jgi:hypothetical protein